MAYHLKFYIVAFAWSCIADSNVNYSTGSRSLILPVMASPKTTQPATNNDYAASMHTFLIGYILQMKLKAPKIFFGTAFPTRPLMKDLTERKIQPLIQEKYETTEFLLLESRNDVSIQLILVGDKRWVFETFHTIIATRLLHKNSFMLLVCEDCEPNLPHIEGRDVLGLITFAVPQNQIHSNVLDLQLFRLFYDYKLACFLSHSIGRWSKNRGLRLSQGIENRDNFRFSGTSLKILAAIEPPHIKIENDHPLILGGFVGELLRDISQVLNFRTDIVSSKYQYYGDPQDRTIPVMIEEFVQNASKYDLSVGLWSMSPSRLRVVDFTTYVCIDDVAFVLRKTSRFNTDTWSLLFRSFDRQLWAALFGVCVIGSLCLALVLWPRRGGHQAEEHKWITTTMAVWLLQGSEGPFRACSSKIVVISVYLFCWIIFAVYNGVLISYLALDTSHTLTTMEQLAASNFEIGTRSNGRVLEIVRMSTNNHVKGFADRIQATIDHETALDNVCSQKNFAQLVAKDTIKYYLRLRPNCSVYFLKERLIVNYYHFVTQSGGVLNKRISGALTRLREIGAIDRIEFHSQLKTRKNSRPMDDDSQLKSIDIHHVFIPFGVLIIGIASSLSILAIEKLYFETKNRKAIRKQQHSIKLNNQAKLESPRADKRHRRRTTRK